MIFMQKVLGSVPDIFLVRMGETPVYNLGESVSVDDRELDGLNMWKRPMLYLAQNSWSRRRTSSGLPQSEAK